MVEKSVEQLVRETFPGEEYETHYKPGWLRNTVVGKYPDGTDKPPTNRQLSISIYIPGLNLGFCASSVSIGSWFDTDREQRRYKERVDEFKVKRCKENGITLFMVPPLLDQTPAQFLKDIMENYKNKKHAPGFAGGIVSAPSVGVVHHSDTQFADLYPKIISKYNIDYKDMEELEPVASSSGHSAPVIFDDPNVNDRLIDIYPRTAIAPSSATDYPSPAPKKPVARRLDFDDEEPVESPRTPELAEATPHLPPSIKEERLAKGKH